MLPLNALSSHQRLNIIVISYFTSCFIYIIRQVIGLVDYGCHMISVWDLQIIIFTLKGGFVITLFVDTWESQMCFWNLFWSVKLGQGELQDKSGALALLRGHLDITREGNGYIFADC